MTFFNQAPLKPAPIEIDLDAVSSTSPQLKKRMDRISDNYQRLELMLAEVESKIHNDQRLSEINESILEIEIVTGGRKRKWRSRRPSKSANPKKPR